jgi:hypothetical protein
VKQIVLCVVLVAFVGEPTSGQDSHSEKFLERTLSQSSRTQDPPEESKPTPKQSMVSGSSSPRQLLANTIDRSPEPFILFVDPFISSTLTTAKGNKHVDADPSASNDQSFHWSAAIKESFIFLGVQHGYALTQPKTRRDLKGPFFKDYARSVKSLHGWGDGGRFLLTI